MLGQWTDNLSRTKSASCQPDMWLRVLDGRRPCHVCPCLILFWAPAGLKGSSLQSAHTCSRFSLALYLRRQTSATPCQIIDLARCRACILDLSILFGRDIFLVVAYCLSLHFWDPKTLYSSVLNLTDRRYESPDWRQETLHMKNKRKYEEWNWRHEPWAMKVETTWNRRCEC